MSKEIKKKRTLTGIALGAAALVLLLVCVCILLFTLLFGPRMGNASLPVSPSPVEPLPTNSSIHPVPIPSIPFVPLEPSPTAQSQSSNVPAIQESRLLTLEWPPVMRAGDADTIRLTLEVDDQGNIIPTAEIEGNAVTGETVLIPDVYATHNIVAAARLDLAGVQVVPSETTNQSLLPGQSVTFYWSIRAEQVGKYRGTAWFYLRFVPLDGGAESEQTISAQPIEIEVVSLLGLKTGSARILGAASTFLSSVLGLPFLEESLKWLYKKVKKS